MRQAGHKPGNALTALVRITRQNERHPMKNNIERTRRVHMIYSRHNGRIHLAGFGSGFYHPSQRSSRMIVVNALEHKTGENYEYETVEIVFHKSCENWTSDYFE